MEYTGRTTNHAHRATGQPYLWVLLAVAYLLSTLAPSLLAEDLSACRDERPGDLIVGRDRPESLTIEDPRSFAGRLIVRNGSRIHFVNTEVELGGDVLLCDASLLRVDQSRVTVRMRYSAERSFRASGGSRFDFTRSVFMSPSQFPTSVELEDSSLTMSFVNRVDLDRPELLPQLAGWTTALINSSAIISDTNYLGEITALFGPSTIRFTRSAGLIVWLNFRDAQSGGTVVPPSAEDNPITWQFDATTPAVKGIDYSIAIEDSRFIVSGVLLWIYKGLPHADVTLRDGAAAIGLIFVKETGVRIRNFYEGYHENFSPPLPDRRVNLQRVRVWSWNVYAWGSEASITDSEIGEIFSESLDGRTARVSVARSKLTGSGGYYLARSPDQVRPPAALIIKDSEIRSRIVASASGLVLLDGSRVKSPAPDTGSELIAEGGTILLLNAELASPVKTIIDGGAVWRASLDPALSDRRKGDFLRHASKGLKLLLAPVDKTKKKRSWLCVY